MTLKELSQLHWLKREMMMDVRRLVEIETVYGGIAGEDNAGFADKTATTAVMIAELKETIVQKQFRVMSERIRLEQYIANVDDSFVRQVLTLRFVDGYSWKKVAMEVGGGNTADNVRMSCKRYLRRN